MGSIVKSQRTDKRTGKTVTRYRAYVRREGYASKSKVCATLYEAKEWLRNHDADSALERVTTGKTFKDLAATFAEAPAMRGTKAWTPGQLEFWVEHLGGMKVGDITRAEINAARAVLMTRPAMRNTPNGPKATKEKLSAATINRYLAALSSVFNYAIENGILDIHPLKGGKVKKLTEGQGRTRILTPDEEGRLLAAAKASSWPMLHLFLRTCLTTAARRGEVLNLQWRDLRLDESIAVLGKTKNGRPRALPLVSDVKVALAAAMKVRPLHSDYVFFDPKDPSKPANIKTAWDACRKAAGLLKDRTDPLDRVYLHSTRHTAVTRLLKGGANLAQAAVVSGHQTLAMLKRYEHLAAQDAVALAEQHLAGNASK